ncbi:MAG: hypothetical protein KDE55_00030 [Novosphingobium sp.]|nr:hypothetical protein [Hyphomicrobiaceae bacterium]MCB2076064.1 hypothetical protein [Novosphingobium sp.]
MSKFVSAALNVAMVGVQLIPGFGQLSLVLRAGITIGLGVGASLTAPKLKQQPRQAAATTLQLGEVPRTAILGVCALPGHLVPAK